MTKKKKSKQLPIDFLNRGTLSGFRRYMEARPGYFHIATIIWQNEEIERLRKRERELESGYLGMCRQNDKLRARTEKRERRENKLAAVNV